MRKLRVVGSSLPGPIPGSGILTVFGQLWQTSFYVGGKLLLLNELDSAGGVVLHAVAKNAKRPYDVSPSAGVAKLVYAPDSKSGEVHSSCRFESDLRHHLRLRIFVLLTGFSHEC
jgi:hypothetical protein